MTTISTMAGHQPGCLANLTLQPRFDCTCAPVFPPGVHDIVANELSGPGGLTEFVCSMGDYAGIVAHTDNPAEMRMARRAAYCHAADKRAALGQCHVGCYDEHGHTDGCNYEGDGFAP